MRHNCMQVSYALCTKCAAFLYTYMYMYAGVVGNSAIVCSFPVHSSYTRWPRDFWLTGTSEKDF